MPKTLLLADASVTMRKVVEMSFASEDVVVITADNGDDAIARTRSERPDVLLVNVGVPGTDGYDVCSAVKSDPSLGHTPVLLLTGAFEPFDEERASQAGADARIMKPFESQVLVDQVNALLARAPEPGAPAEAPTAAPSGEPAVEETGFEFFDDEPPLTAEPSRADAAPDLEPGEDLEPLELEPVAVDPTSDLAEGSVLEIEPEPATPEALFAPEAEIEWSPESLGGPSSTPPASLSPGTPEEFGTAGAGPELTAGGPTAPETLPEPDLAATRLFGDEDLPAAAGPLETPNDESPEDALDLDFAPPPLQAAPPPDLEAAREPAVPGTPFSGAEWPEEADPIADTAPPSAFADPLASLEPEELVEEAVLDPAAARDHDVSSSDLGDPLAEAAAPSSLELEPQGAVEGPAALTIDPGATTGQLPLEAEPEATPPGPEPAPQPTASGPGESDRTQPTTPTRDRGEVDAPTPTGMRDALLRDRLEKLAWEAFGDVSDRIVREAVERIETIAWEVIPQLAEALICEEIRRLKGEDPS